MLQIDDHELLQMFDWNERLRLREILNEKLFQAGDIGFTYRQIGLWARKPFFEDNGRAKGEWRLFSVKELVGMSLLQLCKDFGYSDEDIDLLCGSLFTDTVNIDETLRSLSNTQSDEERKEIAFRLVSGGSGGSAIVAAATGVPMRLLMGKRNEQSGAIYCSNTLYDIHFRTLYPHFANINLNDILDQVLQKLAEKRQDLYFSLATLWAINSEIKKKLTEPEKTLLDSIRDPIVFESFVIQDGADEHVFKFQADTKPDEYRKQVAKIMSLIAQDKCRQISITKRDGTLLQLNN